MARLCSRSTSCQARTSDSQHTPSNIILGHARSCSAHGCQECCLPDTQPGAEPQRTRQVYEPARYMSVAQAVAQLLEVEEAERCGAYGPDSLAVGVARLGAPNQQVRGYGATLVACREVVV